jgi:hypothetical protein
LLGHPGIGRNPFKKHKMKQKNFLRGPQFTVWRLSRIQVGVGPVEFVGAASYPYARADEPHRNIWFALAQHL